VTRASDPHRGDLRGHGRVRLAPSRGGGKAEKPAPKPSKKKKKKAAQG